MIDLSHLHELRARSSRKQKIISIKMFTSTVPQFKIEYSAVCSQWKGLLGSLTEDQRKQVFVLSKKTSDVKALVNEDTLLRTHCCHVSWAAQTGEQFVADTQFF